MFTNAEYMVTHRQPPWTGMQDPIVRKTKRINPYMVGRLLNTRDGESLLKD